MHNDGGRRPVATLVALGAAAIVLTAGLLTATHLRSLPAAPTARASGQPSEAGPTTLPTPTSTAQPQPSPSQGWAWRPLPEASVPFVPARLVIDRLHVQAPVELKAVDRNNVMEAPDRPGDVAWYSFTGRPGSGSNAVFAGHRDFPRVGPAVFWKLDQLVQGDVIRVVSGGQTEIDYRVTTHRSYLVTAMPMQDILRQEPVEELTLITCSGSYSRSGGYDQRLVVRAIRTARAA